VVNFGIRKKWALQIKVVCILGNTHDRPNLTLAFRMLSKCLFWIFLKSF
jgi:hypothetical protein